MRTSLLCLTFFFFSITAFAQLQAVKKIENVSKSENPVKFSLSFNNKYLYCIKVRESAGQKNELWISDGTGGGTIMLKSVAGEVTSVGIINNLYVFFISYYDTNGNDLIYDAWSTDGTVTGTVLIKSKIAIDKINFAVYNRRPRNFTVVNNLLYFIANGGTADQQLWKTDGTGAGTMVVKSDFQITDPNTGAVDLVSLNNQLYFLIKSPGTINSSAVLWKSDGTYTGTLPVLSSTPQSFLQPDFSGSIIYNGKLIFSASDPVNGIEPWITDGTAAGTSLLFDAEPGMNSSYPAHFTLSGNKLFFVESNSGKLSCYDFITDSKINLGGQFEFLYDFNLVNGLLYFKAKSKLKGYEWFVTDGTVAGTELLADIRKGPAGTFDNLFAPVETNVVAGNDQLFFAANDGVHGSELWFSNGAGTNTKLYADIAQGAAWSSPDFMQVINNSLFFTAYDKKDWQIFKLNLANASPVNSEYNPFRKGEWLQTFGAKNYPGTGYFHFVEGITTDSKNNTYIAGRFLSPDNDFAFYDSDTIVRGNPKYTGFSYKDFLVKLGSDGKFRSYKNNGGSNFFGYNAITVDKNDEVVFAAGATAPVVFDSTVINNPEGVCLAKYDSLGNTKWFKIFRSGRFSNIHHVTTDEKNDIIFGGLYKDGFIELSADVKENSLFSGQYFVAKTNSEGNPDWVTNIPVYVGFEGYIKKIITDPAGDIYVLTTLFAPNTSVSGCFTDTSYIQVSKLSESGKLLWNKKFDCKGVINALSLTFDAAGFLNIAGYYAGEAFIDKYKLRSPYSGNCSTNEIIQIKMKLYTGEVTGIGKYVNNTTNIIDMKANADGTYYLLGYLLNNDAQATKPAGFENTPYNNSARQLVLQHRFYNGKIIDEKKWNVSSNTDFDRTYFTADRENNFRITTCNAHYIDTIPNGIINSNINVSVWKYINSFSTPAVNTISSLNDIRVLNNPSGSNILLQLPGTGVRGKITIYNAAGQLLLQRDINTLSVIVNIDISLLAAGVYFVQLPVGNERRTVRILKN